MKKFLLAKKLKMTQLYRDDGTVQPATVLTAGPCVVTDVRSQDKNGYTAVQVGFGPEKKRVLREVRVDATDGVEKGATLDVTQFEAGDIVNVRGVTKGKGFQGVVKRHGFHGSPATHGHKDQLRMPGSIGSTGPQRVLKGTRMAGRMGGTRITVRNLKVLEVRKDSNELVITGAVPGARNTLLTIEGR